MHTSTKEAKKKDNQCEQQEPAHLPSPFLLPGMRHLR